MTLNELIEKYYRSPFYDRVSYGTKKGYQSLFNNIVRVKLKGDTRMLGNYQVQDITREMVRNLHVKILHERGEYPAYKTMRALSMLFELAIMEWPDAGLDKNTAKNLRIPEPHAREVTWTREQILQFCETAREMGYTSVAHIAMTSYALAQRLGDVRRMTGANLRHGPEGLLEVWLTQSKTGTKVWIEFPAYDPFEDTYVELECIRLATSCRSEEENRKFYVFPKEGGRERPWSQIALSLIAREIIEKAGLPHYLRLSDLRRTAATELAASGATEDELQAVGGWKSRQVVSRYVQKTKEAAKRATDKRRTAME